jgi:hypothetical protein
MIFYFWGAYHPALFARCAVKCRLYAGVSVSIKVRCFIAGRCCKIAGKTYMIHTIKKACYTPSTTGL